MKADVAKNGANLQQSFETEEVKLNEHRKKAMFHHRFGCEMVAVWHVTISA